MAAGLQAGVSPVPTCLISSSWALTSYQVLLQFGLDESLQLSLQPWISVDRDEDPCWKIRASGKELGFRAEKWNISEWASRWEDDGVSETCFNC